MKTIEKMLIALAACMVFTLGYAQKETAGWSPAAVVRTLKYDKKVPNVGLVEPNLLSMCEDYDLMDYNTWPCYEVTNPVKQQPGDRRDNIAIWCTKKATYLFEIEQMYWDKMFFHASSTAFIRDAHTGKKYYVQEHLGAPLDVTYWMQGKKGQYFCSVNVYPPLPKTCTTIDIGQDTHPENVPGTTGWQQEQELKNIPVRKLQYNQQRIIYLK